MLTKTVEILILLLPYEQVLSLILLVWLILYIPLVMALRVAVVKHTTSSATKSEGILFSGLSAPVIY